MCNPNMEAKVHELMELKRMKEELEAEIAAAEDAIKAVMGDEELLTAGAYKVSSALKRESIQGSLMKSSQSLKVVLPVLSLNCLLVETVRDGICGEIRQPVITNLLGTPTKIIQKPRRLKLNNQRGEGVLMYTFASFFLWLCQLVHP